MDEPMDEEVPDGYEAEGVDMSEDSYVQVTVRVSQQRAEQWRAAAAAEGDEDDIPWWAANRLREYGGWRAVTRTVPNELEVQMAAHDLRRLVSTLKADHLPGVPGWGLLLSAMPRGYVELGCDVARLVEGIAGLLDLEFDDAPVVPRLNFEAPVEWTLDLYREEIEDFGSAATGWGFLSFPEWVAAAVDTMADHDTISAGLRDATVETTDPVAAAAPLYGVGEALYRWATVEGEDRARTSEQILEAARIARLVMAVRADR